MAPKASAVSSQVVPSIWLKMAIHSAPSSMSFSVTLSLLRTLFVEIASGELGTIVYI